MSHTLNQETDIRSRYRAASRAVSTIAMKRCVMALYNRDIGQWMKAESW